jgi:Type II CAAX prenyl endopeptidase Rce1-like
METTLRILVGLGLTLLLVMLRVEADQFGAAEYDEPVRGQRRSLFRRLGWYVLGVGGIAVLFVVHPSPELDLRLTFGDRFGIVLGLALGLGGVAQAVALAMYHYHHLRLPDVGSYPQALTNEILTAFIDEATFRGALFAYLLWIGTPLNLAILAQAFTYSLATRLGAPGRDRYMFLLSLVIGLLGGWATDLTGGIGAAFLGHAITRVAVFLTTGHAGQLAPRGTEPEEVERRRRTPEGWRVVDREAAEETGRDR